jgi:hypothetical protein
VNGERAMSLALKRVVFNSGVGDETFERPHAGSANRPRTR